MELRNWIEKKIGKMWACPPVKIGKKGGIDCYEISWEDGTSVTYFIDWEKEEIGEVWPGLVRRTAYPHDIIA